MLNLRIVKRLQVSSTVLSDHPNLPPYVLYQLSNALNSLLIVEIWSSFIQDLGVYLNQV